MSRIAIIIASRGRPADLRLWLDHVARQTVQPSTMIWAVHAREDLPDPDSLNHGCAPVVQWSGLGLCCQRNAGLRAVPPDTEIVAFFDDDYVPSSRCIEGIDRLFARYPEVVGATGHVIADGIKTAGISVDEAMRLVTDHDQRGAPAAPYLIPQEGLYGCNMAFRYEHIRHEQFDEQLPLYGWQEDVDFANRMAARGVIGRTNAFAGVHRGAKGGRTNGRRLGYSQVANPIYLARKRSMSAPFAARLVCRNVLMNHARLLNTEPWADRPGRAAGNWMAFWDVVRGRLHPKRILDF